MDFLRRHKLAVVLGFIVLAVFAWAFWSARRNTARKLDLPRLDAARQLWNDKGPKDYRLSYTIQRAGIQGPDTYEVEVRGGKPVEALVNAIPEPPARLGYYGMERLFDFLDQFLDMEQRDPKTKAIHYADFDPADGHLMRYQRHLSGGGGSVEIVVKELK